MQKKPLKFYHLLYLHPPCLFQLSLTAGDHSGPRVHSRAGVPRRAPPAGAAPHRRAAPFPSLSLPSRAGDGRRAAAGARQRPRQPAHLLPWWPAAPSSCLLAAAAMAVRIPAGQICHTSSPGQV